MAPPLTLTRSRSSPSSFSTARYCAANASLTSIEIDVLQRQAGLLEHLARRRRRAHPHQRRLDADVGPVRQPRERLQAVVLHALRRREQQRRAAVDDAAGVAGGDAAVLAERRRQLRQPLHRRVGPHVIVLREELDALARLDLDRHDFLLRAVLPSTPCRRAAGCGSRSASCSSRETSYFAAQFSAVAAIVQPQCVSSSADHSVSSSCPWPRRRPLRRPRITCGAWLMLSMPPVSTTSASPSRIICAAVDRRLDARAAEAIDRQRRHLDRQAGLEPDVPRAIDRVGAGLQDVAEDDVIDVLRLDAGPLHRRARRDRAELDRGEVLQLARVVRHRACGRRRG